MAAIPAVAARICIARFDVCRPETDSVTCPAAAPPERGLPEDTPPMNPSSAPARRRVLQRLAALAAAPLAGG
ncbi:ABC transporter substrate-binding protein, partial [Burkholderia sp. Ax-1735]|nr:ABC transporter substrate-binding protein [Burkholderia sp. Ax-1735]